ncbi:MAG: circadian clock KaiB family protein [Burkholderiaceae bacterium]
MKDPAPTARRAPASTRPEPASYSLLLYVVGATQSSSRAIVNVRKLCEEHLTGRYELEVIDLALDPAAAVRAQIVAAPTLIKQRPEPSRRFIGDMSRPERILEALGVRQRDDDGAG